MARKNLAKLVKKKVTGKDNRIHTVWVLPNKETGKTKPRSYWVAKFGKLALTRLPGDGYKVSEITVHTKGDIHSHAVLSWRDKKTGLLVQAYTQKFMQRNANKKWKRMEKIRHRDVSHIQNEAKKMMKSDDIGSMQSGMVVYILAKTGLRLGGLKHLKRTGHRGILTLRPDDITIKGDSIRLDFIGKKGVENKTQLRSPELAKALSKLKKKHKGSDRIFDIKTDVFRNRFDKMLPKGNKDIKVKDLRTYKANEVAWNILKRDKIPPPPIPRDKAKRKKIVLKKLKEVYQEVANVLNNEPPTAKTSYLHPKLVEQWLVSIRAGKNLLKADAEINKIPTFDEALDAATKEKETRGSIEEEVDFYAYPDLDRLLA